MARESAHDLFPHHNAINGNRQGAPSPTRPSSFQWEKS